MSKVPYFVLDDRVRSIPTSPTLAMNEQCAAMEAAGQEIIKFGFGQSPFPVPPSVAASLRQHAGKKVRHVLFLQLVCV